MKAADRAYDARDKYELKRLNNQTRRLKLIIRDRCGQKGKDWYARLDERTVKRKLGLLPSHRVSSKGKF